MEKEDNKEEKGRAIVRKVNTLEIRNILRNIKRILDTADELNFSLSPYNRGIQRVPLSYLNGDFLYNVTSLVKDLKLVHPIWNEDNPVESIKYMLKAHEIINAYRALGRIYVRRTNHYYKESSLNIWESSSFSRLFYNIIEKEPEDKATGEDALSKTRQICEETIENLKKAFTSVSNLVSKVFQEGAKEVDRIICESRISQDHLTEAMRSYANEHHKSTEKKLKRDASTLKDSPREKLDPIVWEKLLIQEEESLRNVSIENLDDLKRLEDSPAFISFQGPQMVKEYEKDIKKLFSLIEAFSRTCLDGELFDLEYALVEEDLLSCLTNETFNMFCELVLRHNIIKCEVFPNLRPVFEAWLKGPEKVDDDDAPLSRDRQTIYNSIMKYINKGDWKAPATMENVKDFMHVVLGREPSRLDADYRQMPEKLWILFEQGRTGENTRIEIAWANIVGLLSANCLVSGGKPEINKRFFGEQKNLINSINSGKKMEGKALSELKPFLVKYADKIIKGI